MQTTTLPLTDGVTGGTGMGGNEIENEKEKEDIGEEEDKQYTGIRMNNYQ